MWQARLHTAYRGMDGVCVCVCVCVHLSGMSIIMKQKNLARYISCVWAEREWSTWKLEYGNHIESGILMQSFADRL